MARTNKRKRSHVINASSLSFIIYFMIKISILPEPSFVGRFSLESTGSILCIFDFIEQSTNNIKIHAVRGSQRYYFRIFLPRGHSANSLSRGTINLGVLPDFSPRTRQSGVTWVLRPCKQTAGGLFRRH